MLGCCTNPWSANDRSVREAHMERRKFLASSLAASALVAAKPSAYAVAAEESAQGKGREFYQLRRYHINGGPQRKLCDDYFRDALLPALGRLKIGPVGVFDLAIGPETPSIYVLMPSLSAETLATVETHLAHDAEYNKAGAAFLNAPAKELTFAAAWRVRSCRLLRNGRGSSCLRRRPAVGRESLRCARMKAPPIRITSGKWK